MEKRVLNIAVKYWNDRFTGISALDIAEKLKIPHDEAMMLMERLCLKGDGKLNANVTLYQVKIEFDKETKVAKVLDPVPVETHIFFSSKSALQKHYERNLLQYFKYGEYDNRLRKGYGQIDLLYFDIKVLGKYLDNREHYDLNDDITGGVIRLHHDILANMTQEEYDESGFDKIWYGKRKLENGGIAISAILIDLSKLPVKEQSYWHGFELTKTVFVQHDTDFKKFIARAYDGEWVESNDPIANICDQIRKINSTLPEPIFIKTSNPYLKYPTNNSFKDFADANSELYKIIGPDNLNFSNLKKLFLTSFEGVNQDLVHKESQRPLSSLQIMQLILAKLDLQIAENFKKHWSEIKDYRIEGDHKITIPKKTNENHIENFRIICEQTSDILADISNLLKQRAATNSGFA